jgi:hypothetical protein
MLIKIGIVLALHMAGGLEPSWGFQNEEGGCKICKAPEFPEYQKLFNCTTFLSFFFLSCMNVEGVGTWICGVHKSIVNRLTGYKFHYRFISFFFFTFSNIPPPFLPNIKLIKPNYPTNPLIQSSPYSWSHHLLCTLHFLKTWRQRFNMLSRLNSQYISSPENI